MEFLSGNRRLRCQRCLRAQSACICHWVSTVATTVEVVILQHPLEVSHAKGSARLLHLSLPGSCLMTCETLTPAQSQHLFDDDRGRRQILLLYPDSPAPAGLIAAAPRAPVRLTGQSQLRLIVLDGTWRKSRKMLYLNPQLQCLPRLALQEVPASHYRIRKAHRADQLSTLEATCHALLQLGQPAPPVLALLHAFDGFVSQQVAHRELHGSAPPAQRCE